MTLTTKQQRFIKNVKEHPMRGQGEYWKNGNYHYPTQAQMNKFEKYNIVYDVDFALRDLVIELNSKGYKTTGSCQGHIKSNNHGYLKIGGTKNCIPFKYRNGDSPLSRSLLKNVSKKEIDLDEVKSIFKKHGITITKYIPASCREDKQGRIDTHHQFEFPVILDKKPIEVVYYYALNGNLESSYTVPKGHSIKLISYFTDDNYSRMQLVDKGKVIWDKDLSARNKPYATLQIVRELQQAAYKALGMPFDFKKIMEEHNNKNKDSKPIKKIKRVRP